MLANMFLFRYKYSYMKNLIKDNLCAVKQFNATVRCIILYLVTLLLIARNTYHLYTALKKELHSVILEKNDEVKV